MEFDMTKLPGQEKTARSLVDLITYGLRTAPALHPISPCVVVLPTLMNGLRIVLRNISHRSYGTPSPVSSSHVIRSGYPELLDVYASFASSIWTDEQRKTYESCTKCGQHDRMDVRMGYIALIEARGKRPVSLHEMICQIFELLVLVAKEVKSNARKLERKPGKVGKWPSSPAKFIPYGAPKALAAFMKWAQVAGNIGPINALFHLTFCCPSLSTAMDKEEVLFPLIAQLFREFVNSLQKLDLAGLPFLHTDAVELDIMSYSNIFMHAWYSERASNPAFIKANTHSFSLLYLTLADLMPLLPKLKISDENKWWFTNSFESAGAGLYGASLLTPTTHLPLLPTFVKAVMRSKDPENDFRFGSLTMHVMQLRNQRKCVERTCTQTGEETQTDFKTCSGCKVVRYCSKACQVSDWKDHKKACRLLKVLLPIAATYGGDSVDLDTDRTPRSIDVKLREAAGFTQEELTCVSEYVRQHTKQTADENFRPYVEDWDNWSLRFRPEHEGAYPVTA